MELSAAFVGRYVVHLRGEVRNFLDVRATRVRLRTNVEQIRSNVDFIGYPLPGRSFWLSVEIATTLCITHSPLLPSSSALRWRSLKSHPGACSFSHRRAVLPLTMGQLRCP